MRPPALAPAVALLTRLPVGRGAATPDLRRAVAWFPAVGWLVAAIAVAVRAAAGPLVGVGPATLAAVLATVAATGALHEDGLADLADGAWGGTDASTRLAVMRDSRLGTYGTLALVGDLGLRWSLLAGPGVVGFARSVLAAEVLGRAAPAVLLATTRPARPDGLAAAVGRPTTATVALAGTTGVATAAVVAGPAVGTAMVAATAAAVLGVRALARRRLGGVTGDVLGAAVRVTGLVVLVVAAAADRHGALPGGWTWAG